MLTLYTFSLLQPSFDHFIICNFTVRGVLMQLGGKCHMYNINVMSITYQKMELFSNKIVSQISSLVISVFIKAANMGHFTHISIV